MAATLKDIARKVGVSVTTVSRGLAGYSDVAAETRDRIMAVAAELGYSPNVTAQRLQKQRTDMLGFIMPTFGPRFSDPFFSEFIAGIGNEAAAHNYDLLVSTHAPDSEGERNAYLRAVKKGWVDGLIVVRTREDDARIQLLCEHQFPFVAFGRTSDALDFPYVDEDSAAGMRLLVQHFIDLGHERIAFISPPSGLMFGRYRLQGFYETMQANGLAVQPEWIVLGDMTQRGGAEAMESLLALQPRPTAVIGGNDLMAIGAINRIQQEGLQVGQDIAVGGFDDIPLAAYMSPPLTTIHQPIYEIGKATCAMLIEVINGRVPQNPHTLLTPTLIVRASSGKTIPQT
ncbi:MAG: LacI family DNA-binding transcriptional regulator [Ardenticatenaceae bacterium]|nr:LacI family DNA-binding transcriptional regulator [Ardenticatenaceae bacterium]MCB9445464.1 LacI family DNA-binding transcriptional regulator [Ardenticatenaceae bacterium]